jgi:hypothetical protein
MGRFDIPEVLIAMSIVAIVAWAVYNWTHRKAGERK